MKNKVLIGITLSVALLSLISGYAIYSRVTQMEAEQVPLTQRKDIQVVFQDVTHPMPKGNVSGGNASIDGTKITLNNLTLQGESSVSYLFNMKNNGSSAVKVSFIQTVDSNELNQKEYEYKLSYANGDAFMVGDELKAGSVKTLKLTIMYHGEFKQIPNVETVVDFE